MPPKLSEVLLTVDQGDRVKLSSPDGEILTEALGTDHYQTQSGEHVHTFSFAAVRADAKLTIVAKTHPDGDIHVHDLARVIEHPDGETERETLGELQRLEVLEMAPFAD